MGLLLWGLWGLPGLGTEPMPPPLYHQENPEVLNLIQILKERFVDLYKFLIKFTTKKERILNIPIHFNKGKFRLSSPHLDSVVFID